MGLIKNLILIFVLIILASMVTCMGVCGTAAVEVVEIVEEHQEARKEEAREVKTTNTLVEVTSRELANAYKQNEIAADNKYLDKVLRISGVVESIGKDILNDPYVTLKTRRRYNTVTCRFLEKESQSLIQLKKGQKVVLRGRGQGVSLGDPRLKDCVLESVK